ncbi:MAG: hypothetical protein KDA22_12425 [Phycisphaerales bacterium]|nr:hypothetical protein [Phycisphaerales bacterium]
MRFNTSSLLIATFSVAGASSLFVPVLLADDAVPPAPSAPSVVPSAVPPVPPELEVLPNDDKAAVMADVRVPSLRPAVAEPKALGPATGNGLAWLVAHQLPSGAWGQGDEAASMGDGMSAIAVTPSLGDTCIAALALFRADGGLDGTNSTAIHKAIGFILGEIEAADDTSLQVATIHGSRIQMKIGPYVDTFLASLLLSEIKGIAPASMTPRMNEALAKLLRKIEKNQRDDGTWSDQGWAPVLSESIATKGLNRANQAGATIDANVVLQAEGRVRAQLDSGQAFGGGGAAGVALYGGAAQIAVLQDTVNSDTGREKELRDAAENAPTGEAKKVAQSELDRLESTRVACDDLRKSIVDRLEDESFVAGFGSNGGEEFLSYMNIGESLVVAGGDAWSKWDQGMSANLARIQNADGSWTGHHCITGRTFCTSTALLVLMTDRSPVPIVVAAAADPVESAPKSDVP